MSEWRLRIGPSHTYEDNLFNVQVADTANPFGTYAVASIDDTGGTRFDAFPYGTRVQLTQTSDTDTTTRLTIEDGDTYTIDSGTESYQLLEDAGTLALTGDGTLALTGDGFTERFTGYTVERREADRQGADVLEVEAWSFDQFLRRNTVTNDQSGNTISEALEDIIKTDTPVTWDGSNVTVGDDQTLTQSYRGQKVENAIRNLAFKSRGEEFGVNESVEFYFDQREISDAPRDIDNSQWFNYDIPEVGKETVNEVEVWYDGGNQSVTVNADAQQLNLQDSLNLDDPGKQRKEINRPDITDIQDAIAVGEEYLTFKNKTLTGTVTSYGLNGAQPGDIISVTIDERGIDTDFRIAENQMEWGVDENQLTIVEKEGDNDDILVELSDDLKRVEMQDVDRDAIKTRVASADTGVDVTMDSSLSLTDFRVTNDCLSKMRDGWAGDGNLDINRMVFGDDSSGLKRTNTELGNQTNSATVGQSFPDSKSVRYSAVQSQTGVTEIGLEDSDGDLIARGILDSTEVIGETTVDLTVSEDSENETNVVTDSGQTTVRDILADNSPNLTTKYGFGSDGTAPAVGDTALGSSEYTEDFTDTQIYVPDGNTAWYDPLSFADTRPVTINASNELELQQSADFVEAEAGFDTIGTVSIADSTASNGNAVRIDASGDAFSVFYTPEYSVPEATSETAGLACSLRTKPETTGNLPRVRVQLFDDAGQSVGVIFDRGPGNWGGGSGEWTWSTDSLVDSLAGIPETVDPSIQYTAEVEVLDEATNQDYVDIDAIWIGDFRYNYTFDESDSDANDTIEGPELYPDQDIVTFPAVTADRPVEVAKLTSTWNDTSNNQFVEAKVGGDSFTRATNSTSVNATASTPDTSVEHRVGLSRYGSRTNDSPRNGFNGQIMTDYRLGANVEAITKSGIKEVSVRSIIPTNTINGTTLREIAQLDSSDTALTRSKLAEFEVQANQRVQSDESTQFTNPD